MGRIVPRVRFVIEIPVQFEAGRCHFFRRSGLLDDVVAGVRVHFEDAIALIDSALDLTGENVGRAGAGPGGAGYGVAHFLPHQFVCGHAYVLTHQIVERHPQGHVEIVEQIVERVGANERVDLGLGYGSGIIFVVTVAD